MKRMKSNRRILAYFLVSAMILPAAGFSQTEQVTSQESKKAAVFKTEEIDQMLAPVALYPDALLSQIFIASTYPLEVVQAARWAKDKKGLAGDALTAALEKETWDPSVKSLVAVPQVLTMMSEKLDWTQKLGDAFLCQQKEVLASVQKLRAKAKEEGNLKTTDKQKVAVEEAAIVIEPVEPETVYVPVYNPTYVYGSWWHSGYPPYYYYPPGYAIMTPDIVYGTGVALGVAWGYAWGHCDWHHGNVDVDIDRNVRVNPNIDRDVARQRLQENGLPSKGEWKHNAEHRKGVSYRDSGTAKQYGKMASPDAIKNREEFRGRTENISRDSVRAAGVAGLSSSGDRASQSRELARDRADVSRVNTPQAKQKASEMSSRANAFAGMNSGSATRNYSAQGASSRASMNRTASPSRSYSGGSRGGGGRR